MWSVSAAPLVSVVSALSVSITPVLSKAWRYKSSAGSAEASWVEGEELRVGEPAADALAAGLLAAGLAAL
jgi:hypothetical protein